MRRLRTSLSIGYRDLKERALFDWPLTRVTASLGYRALYLLRRWFGRPGQALNALGALWRSFNLESVSRYCESQLHAVLAQRGGRVLGEVFQGMAGRNRQVEARLRDSVVSGSRVFDDRLIILKPHQSGERGVLLVKYSDYFNHFAEVFDPRIFDDYTVVLEPSWVGYFLPDILRYLAVDHPVYVQAWETRDFDFLRSLRANLIPVALGPNAWVDPNVFLPLPETPKTYDVIVVALWSSFKRHFSLFRALHRAALPGMRIACVGQPWPLTLDDIRSEAAYYGVVGQVDFYENISQQELNGLFARSKATLLLSRKEGANKSIIEAMYADVPAFIRSGHNYGTRYPFISAQTGGFYDEADLPDLLASIHRNDYAQLRPRSWIIEHWSPTASTRVLEQAIYGSATGRLQVKVNAPDLAYLDRGERGRLAEEYALLRSYLRPN